MAAATQKLPLALRRIFRIFAAASIEFRVPLRLDAINLELK
jgi:hypothetical protein